MIIGATDDSGRKVSYEYDDAGRLTSSIDLAGAGWHYAYDKSGNLIGVTDPRGVKALTARYQNGLAQRVSVLHDDFTFERADRRVKANNALQQSATFWQNEMGLTTDVQDFSGATTSLRFNRASEATGLAFNGTIVAAMEYEDHQLKGLTHNSSSDHSYNISYVNDRIVRVENAVGVSVADYSYDTHGNVLSATDSKGERIYQYHRDGRLRYASVTGYGVDIVSDNIGLVTQIFNDKGSVVKLSYDRYDKVTKIVLPVEQEVSEAKYRYDGRGLRSGGTYNDLLTSDITYDAVGNMIALKYSSKDGHSREERYVIGERNEVIKIYAGSRDGLSVEYDQAGQVQSMMLGRNIAEVEYDELGRVVDVAVNDEQFLSKDYDQMDIDAVTISDERTTMSTINVPIASSIFGSLDAIAYSRPRGLPYGPVRFESSMARFVITNEVQTSPDSIQLASLSRRSIVPNEHPLNPGPMTFDKPSNNLFIPPELFSVNCYICIAIANPVLKIDGSSSSVVLDEDESVLFEVTSNTSLCFDLFTLIPFLWANWIFFGDGDYHLSIDWSPGTAAWHSYSQSGDYDAEGIADCTCGSIWIWSDENSACVNTSSYTWHKSNFNKRSSGPQNDFFFTQTGNSFSFHINTFTNVSSTVKSQYQSGVYKWNKSGSDCGGSYQSSVTHFFTGEATSNLELKEVSASYCGKWSSSGGQGGTELIELSDPIPPPDVLHVPSRLLMKWDI